MKNAIQKLTIKNQKQLMIKINYYGKVNFNFKKNNKNKLKKIQKSQKEILNYFVKKCKKLEMLIKKIMLIFKMQKFKI